MLKLLEEVEGKCKFHGSYLGNITIEHRNDRTEGKGKMEEKRDFQTK